MRVTALIDQHAVDGGAQVGTVVKIKAAKVKLVGLALTTVLADDQARHGLKDFARPVHGTRLKLLLGYHTFVCSPRLAQNAVA